MTPSFRPSNLIPGLSAFMCLSLAWLANADEDTAAKRRDPAERNAAESSPGFKNLVSIALAFHEYHDIYGHFPPAVVIDSDGKTPRSWRVELLPLVRDHGAEFNKRARRDEPFGSPKNRKVYLRLIEEYGYKPDQSWDSIINRQVLARMPDVYRYRPDPKDSQNSAYYVVTGRGTVFSNGEGSRLDQISDKPSMTLMLVESKQKIPWTKPEDIRWEPEKPFPRFGGFMPGGFLVATCDGAVHFIRAGTDDRNLRALVTKDAGDDFSIPGIPHGSDSPQQ